MYIVLVDCVKLDDSSNLHVAFIYLLSFSTLTRPNFGPNFWT